MARRRRSSIFKRALDLIAFSRISTIIPMDKVVTMRKPIITTTTSKLSLFKKKKKTKNMFKHYNYAFMEEYQFSPSSTPLFPQPRNNPSYRRRCRRLMCCLLCGSADSGGYDAEVLWIDDKPPEITATVVIEEGRGEPPEVSDWSEEDDSIDRRAEKFIERFHQQMRLQRQESALQYTEMLDRSC